MNEVSERVKTDVSANTTITTKHKYTSGMTRYAKFLREGPKSDIGIAEVVAIDNSALKSRIIKSCLISEAQPMDVDVVFGISEETLILYGELFFNMDKLPKYLDKIAYIEEQSDAEDKALLSTTLRIGCNYVYIKYGNLIPDSADHLNVIKRIFYNSAHMVLAEYALGDRDARMIKDMVISLEKTYTMFKEESNLMSKTKHMILTQITLHSPDEASWNKDIKKEDII